MTATDWLALLDADRRGLRLGPPATAGELLSLGTQIAHPIPTDLRDLLSVANGFEDLGGQWQVAWDTQRIVAENEWMWRSAVIDPSRLAFGGDNGAGDPFCLVLNGDAAGAVEERSAIDRGATRSWPNLARFWTDWLAR